MPLPTKRFMELNDWTPVPIERGRYYNKAHAITAYARSDGQGGNLLHPADVARPLRRLEMEGVFENPLQEAILIDGGAAMKVYAVDSDGEQARLELLNGVAAGSRNGAGIDPDGLNLYTLLNLHL